MTDAATTATPLPPLHIDVLTIFPEMIDGYCRQSIIGRAQRDRQLELAVHDIRSASSDAHHSVDDAPFGGGAGMVLAPEPIFSIVESVHPARPIIALESWWADVQSKAARGRTCQQFQRIHSVVRSIRGDRPARH